MDQFLQVLNNVFVVLNNVLGFLSSNPIYMFGIPTVAIIFTILLKGVQFRYYIQGVKNLFVGGDQTEGVSSFRAAALAIGGRVGTGNVAGVTFAILTGGPGAVFWMWISALFSMCTSFVESTLAQVYKEKDEDHVFVGGPQYYILSGLGPKFKPLAIFYSIIMLVSFGLFYISLQVDTIYTSVFTAFGIDQHSVAGIFIVLLMIILCAFAVFGGMRKLTTLTAYIVPFMTIGYFILVLFVIVQNLDFIPTYFQIVFSQAFSPKAIVAGGIGAAIGNGVRRGIFSNEAGQGSGAIASASAQVDHPAQQGVAQMVTVSIDTLIICTLTSFVIILVSTQMGIFVNNPSPEMQQFYNQALLEGNGGELATNAFGQFTMLGINGSYLLALFLFFFAFSSALAEIAYGMSQVKFLFRNKTHSTRKIALKIYGLAVIFMVLITPSLRALANVNPTFDLFSFADNLAALLFYANIVALILLFPICKAVFKDYEYKLKNNLELTFDIDDIKLDKCTSKHLHETSPWVKKNSK